MIRSPVLLLAISMATFFVAVSPATADEAQTASIQFELPANNGLRAHVESFNGEVTLEIRGKGRFVSYEVQGDSTEEGLKAQFGQLGMIDVAFKPTKMRTERPPKGCDGPPSRWGDGLFIGVIDFLGEREYVQIEASQVKGEISMSRESEWQCPARTIALGFGSASLPSTFLTRKVSQEGTEEATLGVSNRRCRCFFAAYSIPNRKQGRVYFYGAKIEHRQGMRIERATFSANAGASAFTFDHKAGTASLRPPKPFRGHGTFERRPHGRNLWRSAIRVPLLGADSLSIRGEDYRARLARTLPGD